MPTSMYLPSSDVWPFVGSPFFSRKRIGLYQHIEGRYIYLSLPVASTAHSLAIPEGNKTFFASSVSLSVRVLQTSGASAVNRRKINNLPGNNSSTSSLFILFFPSQTSPKLRCQLFYFAWKFVVPLPHRNRALHKCPPQVKFRFSSLSRMG